MKKILLAVTAALAITGCSQNEEFESTGLKSEIVFNTIVTLIPQHYYKIFFLST